MSELTLSNEDSNYNFFPHFRSPFIEAEAVAASKDGEVRQEVVVTEHERIFHPIVGGHLNFSSNFYDEDYPVVHANDKEDLNESFTSDIYLMLVVGSISLVLFGLIFYAVYKTIVILKHIINNSLPGGSPSSSSNSVTTTPIHPSASASQSDVSHLAQVVVGPNRTSSTSRRQGSIVTQAQQSFIQGLRSFHHPMFTSSLRRHDDDQPPPYDEPSPPPYHIAIQMRPNFNAGLVNPDPIKIHNTWKAESSSVSAKDTSDNTDGIKLEKFVSIAVVV